MTKLIYFDTEFTGLVPGTTLISLGMVTDAGEMFYAEFSDYNKDLVDEWLTENVLKNCVYDISGDLQMDNYTALRKRMGFTDRINPQPRNTNCSIHTGSSEHPRVAAFGTTSFVLGTLKSWLDQFDDYDDIQLVGDVPHYDMVLLCNLFGGAMHLPKKVNPVAYDICQDICNREIGTNGIDDWLEWYPDMSGMRDAFDLDRRDILEYCGDEETAKKVPAKHNALSDAIMIREVFNMMRNTKRGESRDG